MSDDAKGNIELIAHLRERDRRAQSLKDHLNQVSVLAGKFAQQLDLESSGKLIGLLHDLGKVSREFQNYLLSATGMLDPDSDDYVDAVAKKGKVDHSSAGAQAVYESLIDKDKSGYITAQALALCIASHHSGLIDCLTPDGEHNFQRRIDKPEESTHKEEALKNSGELLTETLRLVAPLTGSVD